MALGRAEASSPRARRRKRRIGRRAGRAQRRAEAAGREDRRFPPASVGWGEGGKGRRAHTETRQDGGWDLGRATSGGGAKRAGIGLRQASSAGLERASERASPPLALLRLPQPAVAATSAAFGPVGSRSPPGQPALFRQRPRQTCCEAAAAAAGARRMVGPRRRQPLLVAAAAGAAPAL